MLRSSALRAGAPPGTPRRTSASVAITLSIDRRSASRPLSSAFSSSAFERKPEFDQHRRHVGAHQDAHRRLHGRPHGQRHAAFGELPREHRRRARPTGRRTAAAPGPTAPARSRASRRPRPAPCGAARRPARRLVAVRRRGRACTPARRAPPARTDQLACRLMNRSALLLLASSVRRSTVTSSSPSRVSSTRRPSRPSMAALRRRAICSVRSFSFVPPAPTAPTSSPPCPASITIVRRPPGATSIESGRRRPPRAGAAAPGTAGGSEAAAAEAAAAAELDRQRAGHAVVVRRDGRHGGRAEIDDEARAVDARRRTRIPG